jgi:hypothetical protein
MATKNLFSGMLNQKPIMAPQIQSGGSVKVQKAPGVTQFAYLGQGNSGYRHPMENHGNDVSQSVWGRALEMKPKSMKGPKNV